MNKSVKELIFVYDADSDLFSQVTDFAHKILAPESYSCALCKLTYGNLSMQSRWRDFLKKIPYGKSFFHRDEFIRKFPEQNDITFPSILVAEKGQLRSLVSANELQSFTNLDALIAALQKRIATLE